MSISPIDQCDVCECCYEPNKKMFAAHPLDHPLHYLWYHPLQYLEIIRIYPGPSHSILIIRIFLFPPNRRNVLPELIFDSWAQYILTCSVLVVAQLVYVLFGFGSGLISVGILDLVFPDIRDVVVLLLLVNLPAEIWVTWKTRLEIRWRPIAALGVGIAVGIPLGALVLRHGEPGFILTALGWFLVVVGIVFLRLPAAGKRSPQTWAAPPTGLVSGLLTGLFGTGGPPLIIWYHLSSPHKAAFRGNLMTIFLLMTFVRVPTYAATGMITIERIASMVVVMPAVLLGGWLGHRMHVEISEILFRRLVSGLLVVLGLGLLLG